MKGIKLRIVLVSLLLISLVALMVVPALLPAPAEAPVSADLMPTFDLADEGAAVLIIDTAPAPAPTPAAAPDFSMLMAFGRILLPASLKKRSALILSSRISPSNRDASVNDSTSAGSGFGGPLKFPL